VSDWILCSSLGLFRKPQVGIRITADDRWALLINNEGVDEYRYVLPNGS
jgi:hypothetical protein